jgi:excisionase family DNA binding protein
MATQPDTAALPPALTTAEAAELLGVPVAHLWKLAREGSAPVPVLRLGRSLRWPTRPILKALGLALGDADDDEVSTGTHPKPSSMKAFDITVKPGANEAEAP